MRSAVDAGVPSKQVLVVDNGSRDLSIEQLELEFPKVQIIRNTCNAGFARAANQGIRVADREFTLLLNNDAILNPYAPTAFANAFAMEPLLALAGGQLEYPDGRLQSAFAPLPSLTQELLPASVLKRVWPDRFLRKAHSNQTIDVESVFGACLAVRNTVLVKVGLLDEDLFFYYEEIDWCRRVRNLQLKVSHVPLAKASHVHGHTANRFYSKSRIELQRSKLTYYKKVFSYLQYTIISALLVVRSFFNATFCLIGCVATLGMSKTLRRRTAAYLMTFTWHMLMRPRSWGFPDKCKGTTSRW